MLVYMPNTCTGVMYITSCTGLMFITQEHNLESEYHLIIASILAIQCLTFHKELFYVYVGLRFYSDLSMFIPCLLRSLSWSILFWWTMYNALWSQPSKTWSFSRNLWFVQSINWVNCSSEIRYVIKSMLFWRHNLVTITSITLNSMHQWNVW